MNKKELIQFLESVKPLFDTLHISYNQYEDLEEQIAFKKSQIREKLSGGQIVGVIIGCCFYIVGGVIYYFYAKNTNAKNNKVLEREILTLQEQSREKLNSLQIQVQNIRQTGITNILPEQYLDATVINNIYSYLVGGRADNLKEALNLFEEEKHRLNMENMQYESLKQAQLNNQLAAYGNIINAANAINNAKK